MNIKCFYFQWTQDKNPHDYIKHKHAHKNIHDKYKRLFIRLLKTAYF